MLQIIAGVGFGILTVGAWIVYRSVQRSWLEQRQLEMFIEELVWDPDDGRWVVDDSEEIKPLKEE